MLPLDKFLVARVGRLMFAGKAGREAAMACKDWLENT